MHLTESQKHSSELISQYFKGNEQIISDVLSFDNLKAECEQLSTLESFIPGGSLDLHFDMILNKKLTAYYRNMANGKNRLLEGISKPRLKKTLKALEKFQTELNEAGAADYLTNDLADLGTQLRKLGGAGSTATSTSTAATTSAVAPEGAEAVKSEIESAVSANGGGWDVTSMATGLWHALTEGGSYIGVLHLCLDFLGLIGDILYPAGVVFDLLNALIYFVRASFDHNKEKKIELIFLGVVSVISGVIPVAGDLLKALKPVSKSVAHVTIATMKGGVQGKQALLMVPKVERKLVLSGLKTIAKYATQAFSKASKLLVKLFEGINKLVGFIPFIGKPLSTAFARFGRIFNKVWAKVSKFADNFKTVEAATVATKETDKVKLAMKAVDGALEPGGYLKYSGKSIIAMSPAGEVLGRFPARFLTDEKIWANKFPGLFKAGADITEDVIGFKNFGVSGVLKLSKRSIELITKYTGLKFLLSRKFLAAFTKQVWKLFMNSNELVVPEMTQSEIDIMGNVEFNNYINDKIKKKKEETGAVHIESVILDAREQETNETVTEYLNRIAKLHGQPSIAQEVFRKTPIDEIDDEIQDMWTQMAKGEIKFADEGDGLVKTKKTDESLIFIKSRKDFLKS